LSSIQLPEYNFPKKAGAENILQAIIRARHTFHRIDASLVNQSDLSTAKAVRISRHDVRVMCLTGNYIRHQHCYRLFMR
jgi:hypothetical protein